MVSAWRRDMPRAGRRAGLGVEKRSSKKIPTQCLPPQTAVDDFARAILSRVLCWQRAEWADASRSGARQAQGLCVERAREAARAALRRQKSWGVWGREYAWSLWALTALALRACGVARCMAGLWKTKITGRGCSCQRHISVHASTASLIRQSAKV